ncbi:HEPN domain-containing protein [Candidatus Pacearchaeota archaeon]|nr:HEPN domain-containing protein [Candidatus Pacearchaeota archaeon]
MEKINIIKPSVSDCKDLIESAGEKLKIAKSLFEQRKWNFVVQNCIESMELSLKGVLGLIIGKYPATHHFQEKESRELYDEAMEIIAKLQETGIGYFRELFLTRLFFITGLWSKSYTNSKYGDKWNIRVYQKLEAEFIIKQTEEFVKNAEVVYGDIIGW